MTATKQHDLAAFQAWERFDLEEEHAIEQHEAREVLVLEGRIDPETGELIEVREPSQPRAEESGTRLAAPESSEALMTVTEVAAFLRTSKDSVYQMISRGQLPGLVRLGKRVLVRRAELQKHVGLRK